MSAAFHAPATSPGDRILVVSASICGRLHDLVSKEARRIERAAGMARKYGAPEAAVMADVAAELRQLAGELAR